MIDTAEITINAGNGGDGIVSFRREKYIPKGGPWGGDGGKGGNIIFEVDDHLNTLTQFRRMRSYKAQNGQNGMKNLMKGKDGQDLIIKIPRGTIIKSQNGEVIKDLTENKSQFLISAGGRGGLGNWHFKSSINRTPKESTNGIRTKEEKISLELKLIADAGLIGMPSSGKSTLLNVLTNSNVKTADYHFTTLEPNLGVIDNHDIILADIPGLIEGAAKGKGLGHDFLRHVERTKVLIHILDGSVILNNKVSTILENYKLIRNELKEWNQNLIEKFEIIAINKIDITEVLEKSEEIKQTFENEGITDILFISAVSRNGLDKLTYKIAEIIKKEKEKADKNQGNEQKNKVFKIQDLKNRRIVFN